LAEGGDVGPAQLDEEVTDTVVEIASNEERETLKEPAPSKSTCVGCKYPNYGLNNFIPRLEVRLGISSNYGLKIYTPLTFGPLLNDSRSMLPLPQNPTKEREQPKTL
jgi:hypothetical protein